MQIWVDADACPKVIKDILFRAAQRTGAAVTLVANQPLATPPAANIRALQVASGFDEADMTALGGAIADVVLARAERADGPAPASAGETVAGLCRRRR